MCSRSPVRGCAIVTRTRAARELVRSDGDQSRAGRGRLRCSSTSASQRLDQALRGPPRRRWRRTAAASCRAAPRRRAPWCARVAVPAQVLERGARAVGAAPEVEARGSRGRRARPRGPASRSASCSGAGRRRAARGTRATRRSGSASSNSDCSGCDVVLAIQRMRLARAALVDEDDVARVVEAREERHHLRGERDRALPGAAGEAPRRDRARACAAAPAPRRCGARCAGPSCASRSSHTS